MTSTSRTTQKLKARRVPTPTPVKPLKGNKKKNK